MNHIRLDAQDDAVKQFVLSLAAASQGAVLELEGRSVACLLPVSSSDENRPREEWTEAMRPDRPGDRRDADA